MAPGSRLESLTTRISEPLIGVFVKENGEEFIRYFSDESSADAAAAPGATEAALSVIGAWSDLDWEEMAAALDEIRHANPPSPPLEL